MLMMLIGDRCDRDPIKVDAIAMPRPRPAAPCVWAVGRPDVFASSRPKR